MLLRTERPSPRPMIAVALLGAALALALALAQSAASHWLEQRMNRAEAELHETWLPMVSAVGDLKSDLDAWQDDPVPLMAERVNARLMQIQRLNAATSDLAGPTPTADLLADVHARWGALQSGRSTDWTGLHDRLRELSVTGLAQSERLAALASGRGA